MKDITTVLKTILLFAFLVLFAGASLLAVAKALIELAIWIF